MNQIAFLWTAVAVLLAAILSGSHLLPAPAWAYAPAHRRDQAPFWYALRRRVPDAYVRAVRTYARAGTAARRFKPVENSVTVIVVEPIFVKVDVNVKGETEQRLVFTRVAEYRRRYIVRNTVLPVLFPELARYKYPVVIVQWPEGVTAEHMRQTFRVTFPKRDQTPEVLSQMYDASWFAGSNAKGRKTYGFPVGFEPGKREFFTTAEAASKMGRALLPNGVGAFQGNLRVLVVRDGQDFNGHRIEDGFGLIASDLIYPMCDDVQHIMLGESRQNAQIWQNLAYKDIKDDAERCIEEWWAAECLNTSRKYTYKALNTHAADIRRRLVEANLLFEQHPFWANDTAQDVVDWTVELSTTLPIPIVGYVAVPTSAHEYILPTGTWGIVRWPVASNDGLSLAENNELNQKEADRIASFLGAAQLTVTDLSSSETNGHLKGLFGILEREQMGDWDIVTSQSNFKLGVLKSTTDFKNKRQRRKAITMDAVVTVMSIYDTECLLGVPNDSTFMVNGAVAYGNQNKFKKDSYDSILLVGWKDKAGDFDGDMVFVMDLSRYPQIVEAIRGLKHIPSLKNDKTRTPPEQAPEFLLNIFNSPLGWMTVIRGRSLACTPEARQQLPLLIQVMTGVLKTATLEAFDFWLSSRIQGCVDAFKSMAGNCNSAHNKAIAGQVQKVFNKFFGGPMSFQYWKDPVLDGRGNVILRPFVDILPDFLSNLPQDYLDDLVSRSNSKDEDVNLRAKAELACHLAPRYEGGTIAEFYRLHRRYLKVLWPPYTPKASSLSTFYHMAPVVSESDRDKAMEYLRTVWAEFHTEVVAPAITEEDDYSDMVEATIRWENEWAERCTRWAVEAWGGDRRRAAAALWRACHFSTTTRAEAAAVFYGFPDESVSFAAAGGRQADCKTLVRGIGYHFEGEPPEKLEGVRASVVNVDGRLYVVASQRLASNQIWDDGQTPEGCLGVVPVLEPRHLKRELVTPLEGEYELSAEREGKVYILELKSLG